jgi:hypothetical protein
MVWITRLGMCGLAIALASRPRKAGGSQKLTQMLTPVAIGGKLGYTTLILTC